jgi:hypothetical protein
MISHRHRFVFIHIPRTGGTSLAEALRDESCELLPNTHDPRAAHAPANHLTLHEIASHGLAGPEVLRSYFKFCFVRNPWDRLISEICCRWLRPVFDGLTMEQSIREGCRIAATQTTGYANHLRPQSDFVASGDLEMDFVGRFEDLTKDFEVVCERVGTRRTLPVRDRSQHTSYWAYYNRETRDLVAETYRRDVELFAYSFAADELTSAP